MSRLRHMSLNMLWFLSCLPGYRRFLRATRDVRSCQEICLRTLLRRNEATRYGRRHGFRGAGLRRSADGLPITGYEEYRPYIERIMAGDREVLTHEAVRILQPTSGTSAKGKLIPFTRSLAGEFGRALDAWIADLFLQRPRLLLGPQYWAISPSSNPPALPDSRVPVGFLDDDAYLGGRCRRLTRRIMAVPAAVRDISGLEESRYVTALFLLRAPDLGLISVWHPSFLTGLLAAIRTEWPSLLNDIEQGGIRNSIGLPPVVRNALEPCLPPAPKRARALRACCTEAPDLPAHVWPNLQVISCWREGSVQAELAELHAAFPDVLIQGKGLLATEGVVSIPLGPRQETVCAITSHYLEFLDDQGGAHPAWGVEAGHAYEVLLTTGGGLYRYRLKDRVEVTGFRAQAPCIRFLGRAGGVSDMAGEKLHLEHVETVLRILRQRELDCTLFAVLIPSTDADGKRYNLIVERTDTAARELPLLAQRLDSLLKDNYHYAHAREIGQLRHATALAVAPGAADRFRAFMVERGAVAASVKFPALCTLPGAKACLLGEDRNERADT